MKKLHLIPGEHSHLILKLLNPGLVCHLSCLVLLEHMEHSLLEAIKIRLTVLLLRLSVDIDMGGWRDGIVSKLFRAPKRRFDLLLCTSHVSHTATFRSIPLVFSSFCFVEQSERLLRRCVKVLRRADGFIAVELRQRRVQADAAV